MDELELGDLDDDARAAARTRRKAINAAAEGAFAIPKSSAAVFLSVPSVCINANHDIAYVCIDDIYCTWAVHAEQRASYGVQCSPVLSANVSCAAGELQEGAGKCRAAVNAARKRTA